LLKNISLELHTFDIDGFVSRQDIDFRPDFEAINRYNHIYDLNEISPPQ